MEMCTFKQAAREADVVARLAAKRKALGNLTILPMSATSPPSSSSNRGSSLSLYAVRADPAPTRGQTPRSRLLVRHCSASHLLISAIDGLMNHSFVTQCSLPYWQAAPHTIYQRHIQFGRRLKFLFSWPGDCHVYPHLDEVR